MLAMLCGAQCESNENSIIQLRGKGDNGELKVPSNLVIEEIDKVNNIDLQQGWGKAVSFITNTSSKSVYPVHFVV